jgi:hypothetical protein
MDAVAAGPAAKFAQVATDKEDWARVAEYLNGAKAHISPFTERISLKPLSSLHAASAWICNAPGYHE